MNQTFLTQFRNSPSMASSLTNPLPPPLRIHAFPSKPNSLSTKKAIFLPRIPFRTPRITLSVQSLSAPTPPPEAQQYILDIIDGDDVKSVPCVRTYENDLGLLTVVGAVDLDQALTAAAADGGEAASEHIAQGVEVMVAETVYPGPSDEHSTISTRLFLPARKVKQRAKALKNYLTEDVLSSTTSTNILAMTFRQVTVQQLWSYELVVFRPGTTRNMEDLGNPREVSASFALSSSDERAISVLAEVISVAALESAKRHFLDISLGKSSYNLFRLFHKPGRIISEDSSVILYKLLEDGLVGNAKSLLEKFNSAKASNKPIAKTLKFKWWTSSVFSKLEEIGGPEFSAWVSEFVPAYRLQINSDKLQNIKCEGWKESGDNLWGVLLSHSQMVFLANIIDMYYEDLFTLPDKQLPSGIAAKSTTVAIKKKSSSSLKMLSTVIASGLLMVGIGIMGRPYFPHFHNHFRHPWRNHEPQSSQMGSIQHGSMESNMDL